MFFINPKKYYEKIFSLFKLLRIKFFLCLDFGTSLACNK
jgi:hypothetical protein